MGIGNVSAAVFFSFAQNLILTRCSIFEPNRRRAAVEGSSSRRSMGLNSRGGSELTPVDPNELHFIFPTARKHYSTLLDSSGRVPKLFDGTSRYTQIVSYCFLQRFV